MPSNTGIKVAVRVRPFNKREKELDCKLIVKMTGNSCEITNPVLIYSG